MKTQKQLSAFKKQVEKTRTFLSFLTVVWPNHDLLSLLLQNLSFDVTQSTTYSYERDLKRCEAIIKALKELKERTTNCPVTQYICEEIDLLYTGYVIMADM